MKITKLNSSITITIIALIAGFLFFIFHKPAHAVSCPNLTIKVICVPNISVGKQKDVYVTVSGVATKKSVFPMCEITGSKIKSSGTMSSSLAKQCSAALGEDSTVVAAKIVLGADYYWTPWSGWKRGKIYKECINRDVSKYGDICKSLNPDPGADVA